MVVSIGRKTKLQNYDQHIATVVENVFKHMYILTYIATIIKSWQI